MGLLLPVATRPPLGWTYNLWPRNGGGQHVPVSDLAPDYENAPVEAVPGPASPIPIRGESEGDVAGIEDPSLVRVVVEATGNANQSGRFALDIPHVLYPASRLAAGSYASTAAEGGMPSTDFATRATPTAIPGVLYLVETADIKDGPAQPGSPARPGGSSASAGTTRSPPRPSVPST
jgi:hypothetical protein